MTLFLKRFDSIHTRETEKMNSIDDEQKRVKISILSPQQQQQQQQDDD